LNTVGNIIEDDVPIGEDEHKHNKVITKWGKIRKHIIDGTPGNYHHHEVLHHIDGFDQKRGTKIAGHRGYFLKGPGCFLNFALA
jgi:seryl-tRNA synthetase